MRQFANRYTVLGALMPAALAAVTIAAEPIGTGFTYQGQLKLAGSPVTDTCDFEFTLWDDAVAILVVNQVGPTLIFDGGPGNSTPVEVVNGLFEVGLDFGSSAFNGDARWLQVDVCCSSPCTSGFTILTPRQELTPAPYALFALNGRSGDGHSLDAADGVPVDAVFVDNDGNVGIGTDVPSSTLEVTGNVEVTNLLDNDATSLFDDGCGDNAHVTSISASEPISYLTDTKPLPKAAESLRMPQMP